MLEGDSDGAVITEGAEAERTEAREDGLPSLSRPQRLRCFQVQGHGLPGGAEISGGRLRGQASASGRETVGPVSPEQLSFRCNLTNFLHPRDSLL